MQFLYRFLRKGIEGWPRRVRSLRAGPSCTTSSSWGSARRRWPRRSRSLRTGPSCTYTPRENLHAAASHQIVEDGLFLNGHMIEEKYAPQEVADQEATEAFGPASFAAHPLRLLLQRISGPRLTGLRGVAGAVAASPAADCPLTGPGPLLRVRRGPLVGVE